MSTNVQQAQNLFNFDEKEITMTKIMNHNKSINMKVGGLFAGIGGIELGFKKAGFEISWANEIDKNAAITYRRNHKHTLFEKDLKELQTNEVEKIDILTGGFPYQNFLVA